MVETIPHVQPTWGDTEENQSVRDSPRSSTKIYNFDLAIPINEASLDSSRKFMPFLCPPSTPHAGPQFQTLDPCAPDNFNFNKSGARAVHIREFFALTSRIEFRHHLKRGRRRSCCIRAGRFKQEVPRRYASDVKFDVKLIAHKSADGLGLTSVYLCRAMTDAGMLRWHSQEVHETRQPSPALEFFVPSCPTVVKRFERLKCQRTHSSSDHGQPHLRKLLDWFRVDSLNKS